VAVGRRREDELAGGDVRDGHRLPAGDGRAVVGQGAGGGQGGDLHRREVVRRAVGGVAEAEVGHRERVAVVLQDRHRLVGTGGGVVDEGRDVDGEGPGVGVGVLTAVGGAAVVLHLERE